MKKIFFLSALAALLCTACKEKEPDSFQASASQTSFTAEGGVLTVKISTNISYSVAVQEGSEWIIPVKTKAITESTLSFQVLASDEVEERKGQVVFSSALGEKSFNIVQSGVPPVLSVVGGEEILPAEGGSFTVEMTSNGEPEIDIAASWIRKDQTKAVTQKQVSFLVDPNTESDMRKATLYFRWKGLSQSLTVTQAMPVKYELVPGFYGLLGLNWTYVPQKMQLLVREPKNSSEKVFLLFEPATDRFIQIQYRADGAFAAGTPVVATILQNVDPSCPSAQRNVTFTVKSLSGPFIVLEDAGGHEAIIKK